MTFDEVLEQVRELLQSKGRVAYRALKRRFEFDDEYLEDLKAELIDAEQVARDEDGKVLVWKGGTDKAETEKRRIGETEKKEIVPPDARRQTLDPRRSEGERRQLTVMFCDLVGSTALSAQLDPEELREVIQAYQQACVAVITRFEGHVAKYLGDGLLVYFGYPTAHEDDAARAVRTGLGIIEALHDLNTQLRHPLNVRIGIHTGLVVAGEMGSGEYREQLAIVGETPNIAARLQERALPNSVVISPATYRLITGLFECQNLGPQTLKGISTPLSMYQVVGKSEAQSRFEAAVRTGLTPLVGRDEELALLRRRWAQAQDGEGHVVLLSGEAGIGKSRLVQELKDHVAQEGAVRIEFRCSPYHQNSAFYPLIEQVQRVLHFAAGDTPQDKLRKLEQTLSRYRFPQSDTVPLLAALLSLPQPEGSPPLPLTPQQQKQKTLDALSRWLFEESERATVYNVWEDLHWADPSTLEFLGLCIDQAPTARMLMVLTFRPEFTPAWASRAHLSHLVLSRLGRKQSSAIVEGVTGGKALPAEVIQQVVAKTDGVPLFVEELTKMVLESELLRETDDHYELLGPLPSLAIPSTLQDSLMARLDRLATAREVAQLGATIGRDFSYELLAAIAALDDTTLQQGLMQLLNAELLYQRGLPPRAHYSFKHALVQDAAYHSLLKSKRQRVHQQIAYVLAGQFPDTVETQPELVAHHYTEAGLVAQAIPYWQRAGERAVQRSANAEAINHLMKGLELLEALPDTPEHSRQELALRMALGPALIATKGNAAPEVEHTYTRALELCRREGEIPQLFPVLFGLRSVYLVRGEIQTAHELGEQLLSLAENVQDSGFLLEARIALGNTSFFRGDLIFAHMQFVHTLGLYDLQQHRSHAFVYGLDPGVVSLGRMSPILWLRGYPDQALQKAHDALALAREISHSFSSAIAGLHVANIHLLRQEPRATQQHAEATITLCAEHKFANFSGQAMISRGWALAEQGLHTEGIAQIRQGLAACQATGARLLRPWYLAFLIDACWKAEQTEEGLGVVAEALTVVDKNGERYYEAELYRLKGELLLRVGERGRGRVGDFIVFSHSPSLPLFPRSVFSQGY